MTSKLLKTVLVIFLSFVLLIGSFSGGILVGWFMPDTATANNPTSIIVPTENPPTIDLTETQNPPTDQPATPVPQPQVQIDPTPRELRTLFEPFWQAWDIIHAQFVDQPVDDIKLLQGAINGMLQALGDKHSSYMTPDEYTQATMPMEGEYEGIGAWVDTTQQFLTVVSPMPNSPAEKAGLKPGDQIIKINGEDMTGVDPSIALKQVLGPAGTNVTLTILREGVSELFDVTITRAKITLPSAEGKMLEGNIAYVQIFTFGDQTMPQLEKALKELLSQNPKGLIVDLRNNGGGLLSSAIEVASQFIADGTIMYEVYGDGSTDTYRAIPGGLATQIPLVVLVNEGTASASEIVAGAIQDYNRGQLIGVTTYGKGSVQNWIRLTNDAGAIRVTIARWLTPNERQINEIGLTPDVEVTISEEDIAKGLDPQLEKAIELFAQLP